MRNKKKAGEEAYKFDEALIVARKELELMRSEFEAQAYAERSKIRKKEKKEKKEQK